MIYDTAIGKVQREPAYKEIGLWLVMWESLILIFYNGQ